MNDEDLKRQADSDWIDHTDSPYERYLELKLRAMRAERDRLLTAATGIYNEIILHAPNIISRSQEFVRLAIALDAVAAGEVVDEEKEGEPAQT